MKVSVITHSYGRQALILPAKIRHAPLNFVSGEERMSIASSIRPSFFPPNVCGDLSRLGWKSSLPLTSLTPSKDGDCLLLGMKIILRRMWAEPVLLKQTHSACSHPDTLRRLDNKEICWGSFDEERKPE